ncbi:MAG: ECF transporter S component [Defluviitaleaceae bacterium]|nr:ECF transporter S component [Defluviitaleaceae bacterium]
MNEKTRKLVVTAILCGITVVLSLPFVGTLILPVVAGTLAFIPAMVAAILLGFWNGVSVAFVAGAASMIRGFFMPGLLAPYFVNPLISIFPRVMIAVMVWLVFNALMKTGFPKTVKVTVSTAVAAAVGSLTNTALVLGSIYLYHASSVFNYGQVFSFIAPPLPGLDHASLEAGVTVFFMGIASSNGLIEMVVNMILVTILVLTLRRAKFAKF